MNFNLDRIAKLAGLSAGKASLNEAGNRSYHEDAALSSEADVQWGNQLNEMEHPNEVSDLEEGDDLDDGGDLDEGDDEDVVLEIDEDMLREEILKMKNARSKKVNEAKARSIIKSELSQIFEELGLGDSSWVYGNNKPRNSKKGRVNLAFPGPGFRK